MYQILHSICYQRNVIVVNIITHTYLDSVSVIYTHYILSHGSRVIHIGTLFIIIYHHFVWYVSEFVYNLVITTPIMIYHHWVMTWTYLLFYFRMLSLVKCSFIKKIINKLPFFVQSIILIIYNFIYLYDDSNKIKFEVILDWLRSWLFSVVYIDTLFSISSYSHPVHSLLFQTCLGIKIFFQKNESFAHIKTYLQSKSLVMMKLALNWLFLSGAPC